MKKLLLTSAAAALAFTAAAQGAGFGGFAPAQIYGVAGWPREVRAADLNGDGILDLVTCNSQADSLGVLMGHGDGTFDPAVFYAVGDLPRSVLTVDVDGDGDIDLTVGDGNDATIYVFLNDGAGTFTLHQVYAFDFSEYWGVIFAHTMADFDGDGDSDIALIMLTPNLVVFMPNDGAGTFGPPQVFDETPDFEFPNDLEPADFDNDGDMDLIMPVAQTYTRVYLNDGAATFTALPDYPGPGRVVTPPADFNGDGILDVAQARNLDPGGYITVRLGNGDGTFGPETIYPANRPSALTTSDMDGDGIVDLVVTNSVPYHTVSVRLGNGDGTFQLPQPFAAGGTGSQDPIAVDLDGDSWPDVVNVNFTSANITVLINLTCGGDLDGDGDVDLSDLAQLLSHYGTTSGATHADGDVDRDGDVDLEDLAALLSSYGMCPYPS